MFELQKKNYKANKKKLKYPCKKLDNLLLKKKDLSLMTKEKN